jgi:hypothetical protein
MAAAVEATDAESVAQCLDTFMLDFAHLTEQLSVGEVLRDINEDRSVAGFQEVRAIDQLESELAERRRYYRDTLKDALNGLPTSTLVQVMTVVVDNGTCSGEEHAPKLIDDLVDSYSAETQEVLDKEAENVNKLIEAVSAAAGSGEAAVKSLVDKLCGVVRNWDTIAQPIQLSAKARGIEHEQSRAVAYAVRGLSIDLFNKHNMLEQCQRLTDLLRELFSEVPDVLERVEQDAGTLSEISQQRSESPLIDPIRKLCVELSAAADQAPDRADRVGQRLLDEGPRLLGAVRLPSTSPTFREAGDLIAATAMHCAISYGNATSKWQPCVLLLQGALEHASNEALSAKLIENLKIARSNFASLGDLKPIKGAPGLATINGFGTTLYGRTDPNPLDGSHIATYYFVALFIPIFPIARYRVIPIDRGYRFLGKGPLRKLDKWHLGISLGLIALLILSSMW